MIRFIAYAGWGFVGVASAYVFLKSQSWSVKIIHPDLTRLSLWLVIGGAVIRLLFLTVIITLALLDSVFSGLIFFLSFTMSRLLILFKWQKIHLFHLLKSRNLKG